MDEHPAAGPVRDPTLYRVLPLAAWIPGDSDPRAEIRRQFLERALGELDLAPPGTRVPPRDALAWKDEERWSAYAPESPSAPGAWRAHRYGRSYHELLVVLAGVEQAGAHPFGAEWDRTARDRLREAFGADHGLSGVTLGRIEQDPRSVAAFGEVRLWTGEWASPPAAGWTALGVHRYGADGFAAWPWGLLGYTPEGDDGLPRFDLHTTEAEADRHRRDAFLFQDLLVLIAEWLKATRFHWRTYRESLGPSLDAAERRIRDASEVLPAAASETEVGDLSELLFSLCHREAELEDATRAVAIARDAVASRLQGAAGGLRGALRHEIGRHARQMRSDLAYYRTSERRARAALEAVRTLAEVKENEIETWRGNLDEVHRQFQERLTNWLAAFGLAVGVGQILPARAFPRIWTAVEPVDEPFLARLAACAGLGVIGYLVSRTLQRLRARRIPPPPPPT